MLELSSGMKFGSWLGRCDDETESTCRGFPLLRSLYRRRRRRRRRYRVARMNRVRDCLAPRRTRTQIYNESGGCAAEVSGHLGAEAGELCSITTPFYLLICFDKRAVGLGHCTCII